MSSIIIVFPKLENGKRMKDILLQNGFEIEAVCSTGASVLEKIQQLDYGIIVGSYRYTDMFYTEMIEYLPREFKMLLVASEQVLDQYGGGEVMTIRQPFKVSELVDTLHMMEAIQEKQIQKKARSKNDKKRIEEAKQVLMARNHMTEEEAHRYLQKTSMDSGTNMVETAQMILMLMS